jgi:hypothetical protein
MALRYKFVELSTVTDESLERCVNACVAEGWSFDGIHFVTRESSRRPSMAFVAFVRDDPDDDSTADGG